MSLSSFAGRDTSDHVGTILKSLLDMESTLNVAC